jgi:hypothetical protein
MLIRSQLNYFKVVRKIAEKKSNVLLARIKVQEIWMGKMHHASEKIANRKSQDQHCGISRIERHLFILANNFINLFMPKTQIFSKKPN